MVPLLIVKLMIMSCLQLVEDPKEHLNSVRIFVQGQCHANIIFSAIFLQCLHTSAANYNIFIYQYFQKLYNS